MQALHVMAQLQQNDLSLNHINQSKKLVQYANDRFEFDKPSTVKYTVWMQLSGPP